MAEDNPGREIFRALCSNSSNAEDILKRCSRTAEGPLLYCTIHNSTALHLACSFRKFELANKLLDSMDESLLSLLAERTNAWGDTVLHNASMSNKGMEFVKRLLLKVPDLITARNKSGESCVFYAIRYGKKGTLQILANEVDKFCTISTDLDHLHFYRNNNNTTILHMAVLTRQFDVAVMISKRYPELCDKKDKTHMTAFQMLACSPTAFKSGANIGRVKELIYSIVLTDEQDIIGNVGIIRRAVKFILSSCCQGKSCFVFPLLEEIRDVKKGNQDALNLAKILTKWDTSWMYTYKPRAEVTPVIAKPTQIVVTLDAYRDEAVPVILDELPFLDKHPSNKPWKREVIKSESDASAKRGETSKRHVYLESHEPPLFLAARKGCIEIVEEILEMYPQAVDYLNHDQENLLHVAIKTRNLNILKLIEGEPYLFRLLRTVDNKSNTILHMVGCPPTEGEVSPSSKMKSPVLELSEELLLLERLEEMCPSYLVNHRNEQMLTARELFANRKEPLRSDAKDWLRRTAEHCTVLIILIATVAFAAAYTIPGGPNEQGFPILGRHPLFIIFAITDVLSLGFALTAVVVFLTILTSPYRLKDFRRSLPQKLWLGFTLLFLSVSMMMVAFAATIILMIHSKERWTKIALYIVAFFPIFIFMLSYIPLYKQLLEISSYWIRKIRKSLPRPARDSRPAYWTTTFQSV